MARKTDQTLKIHKLERKCSRNGDAYIKFFKMDGIGAKMKSSMAMFKPVKVMTNVRNAWKVVVKVKSAYVLVYVINGTSNLSNFI